MRKGGEHVCAKMGRPKLDDPKSIRVAVRVDRETLAKLNEIAETNSLTKGQVVRQGIELLYRHIKK
jgi:hypothetical protein